MDLARIIGTIVSTQKVPEFAALTIFVIQPLDEHFQPMGKPVVATDASHRYGVGDVVYYVAGGDAIYVSPGDHDVPVDAAIIGIVDSVNLPPGPSTRP